jgi:hypothetical protein
VRPPPVVSHSRLPARLLPDMALKPQYGPLSVYFSLKRVAWERSCQPRRWQNSHQPRGTGASCINLDPVFPTPRPQCCAAATACCYITFLQLLLVALHHYDDGPAHTATGPGSAPVTAACGERGGWSGGVKARVCARQVNTSSTLWPLSQYKLCSALPETPPLQGERARSSENGHSSQQHSNPRLQNGHAITHHVHICPLPLAMGPPVGTNQTYTQCLCVPRSVALLLCAKPRSPKPVGTQAGPPVSTSAWLQAGPQPLPRIRSFAAPSRPLHPRRTSECPVKPLTSLRPLQACSQPTRVLPVLGALRPPLLLTLAPPHPDRDNCNSVMTTNTTVATSVAKAEIAKIGTAGASGGSGTNGELKKRLAFLPPLVEGV